MPLPGSSPSRAVSQPSRASAVGSDSTPSRRLSRASEPRTVRTGAPPAPSCSTTSSTTRALAVAVVASTGRPGGEVGEQVADPPVVGPEVVAPVADAVRLVDDEQPGRLGQPGELLVPEPRVVQPLGAHQQQVDLVGGQRRGHLGPLVGVGGVHRHGAQTGPPGGVDLVAHQRQQRRHDQRGAAPAGPDQRGGDEVDRRLAPAGALDHEHPLAALDQRRDRLELAVAELRRRVADQPAQQGLRLRGEGGRGSGWVSWSPGHSTTGPGHGPTRSDCHAGSGFGHRQQILIFGYRHLAGTRAHSNRLSHPPGGAMRGRSVLVIAGLAIAAAVAAGTPAAAAPIDKGHFHDVFTGDVYDDCGFPAQDSGDVSGNFLFNQRGSSPFPYYRESVHGTVVTTNLESAAPSPTSSQPPARTRRSSTTATGPSPSPRSPPVVPASTMPTANWCSRTPVRSGSPSTSTTWALPVTPAMTSRLPDSFQLVRASTGNSDFSDRDFCADLLEFTT